MKMQIIREYPERLNAVLAVLGSGQLGGVRPDHHNERKAPRSLGLRSPPVCHCHNKWSLLPLLWSHELLVDTMMCILCASWLLASRIAWRGIPGPGGTSKPGAKFLTKASTSGPRTLWASLSPLTTSFLNTLISYLPCHPLAA